MKNKRTSSKIKYLATLYKYLTPYKVQILFMIIALLSTSTSVLALGQSLKHIIDWGISKHNVLFLNKALFFLGIIIFVLGIGTAFRYYFTHYIGENTIKDIKRDLYSKILNLSVSYYEKNKSGEILSKATSDTTLIQNIVSTSVSIALRNIVMFVGAVVMLFVNSYKLTLFLILIIPCVIIPIIFIGKKLKVYSKSTQDKIGDLVGWIEETINFIKTIQSYTGEKTAQEKFETKLSNVLIISLKAARIRSVLIFLVITLVFSGIVAVLWIGSHYVANGSLTAGDLSAFIFLSIIAASSIGGLTEIISDLQKAGGACERIVNFLQTKPEIIDSKSATKLKNTDNISIEFKNVTFYYPSKPSIHALKNLNLKIKDKEQIAIVGKSGAGKSTLFQLLLRFYDTGSGEIFLNNQNIKNIQLQNLRSQFAYVSQDPAIFSTSVYENIKYGNLNATKNEIYKAAESAAAYEFIKDLPNDFQTFLGEKGVRISGGQKQRIVLARAILKNPKILLLDEATSSLDSHNEKVLQNALEKFAKERITITIAHRLSTVINADKIFVFDKGQIVANGAHKELLKASDYYNEIFQHQKDLDKKKPN